MGEEKLPTEKDTRNSKNTGKVLEEELLKEATGGHPAHSSRGRRILRALAVPVLAMFTALVIGGLFIVLTTPEFYAAWKESPVSGLKEGWNILVTAYSALFTGAIGDPQKMIAALQSGDPLAIRKRFTPSLKAW